MIISKYGISLVRLALNDVELIREKRNLPEIRNSMIFKEFITLEMQMDWFNSINNIYNNYFIIEYDNKKVGLINGKNIDYEKRTSEGGVFFWEDFGTTKFIPALCSTIMNDYTFLINEFYGSYIKVLNNNSSAISYNKQIGYKKTESLETDGSFSWYELTKEGYLRNSNRIRKGIGVLTGDVSPLDIANFSFVNDTDYDLVELYSPLPQYLKDKINIALRRENRILI